jgi:hypothetical protein
MTRKGRVHGIVSVAATIEDQSGGRSIIVVDW